METSFDSKKDPPVWLRIARVAVVLFIAVGVAVTLVRLKKEPEKQEIPQTPLAVNVIEVNSVPQTMEVDAFGTVKPGTLVKLAAEVPGKIDYINPSFLEGGLISKGAVMIRIDKRAYRLDREAAKVRLQQAKTDIESLNQDIENLHKDMELSQASMELAQKELDRTRALTKSQFASKTLMDKVEQQYLQARIAHQAIQNRLTMTGPLMEQKQAALTMAKVDFERADLAYEKTSISAPFDGWVLDKFLETGEYVSPGQPIGSIYKKGDLDVEISIPIEEMRWLNPVLDEGKLLDAQVSIAGPEGDKEQTWPAKVSRFKANIDEKTRTLPMTLEIDMTGIEHSNGFALKPGAFVKCSIRGIQYDNLFVLPRHLLKPGNILFTINDSHLKMKKVEVLRKFEENIFVLSGLEAGDKIISSPLPGAKEGMALAIKTNGK